MKHLGLDSPHLVPESPLPHACQGWPRHHSSPLGSQAGGRYPGRKNWTWDWEQPYQSFCTLYRRLGELAGLRVSNRALDRYLYLAGQLRHWLKNPDALLSREVRVAFRNPELAGDLERLGVQL